MRFLLIFLFLILTQVCQAQVIQVLDKESEQPVFNVAIYNVSKSKSTLTDFDGKANLDIFSADELLIFSHVSHKKIRSTKARILKSSNIVYLQPNQNQLEEVVLSVAGFEQEKRNLPQKVLSISRKNVIFSNPQTSADLLENSGQVYVQKSQLGGGSPMIRGFATNRLLITVDGVRMNTAIFRGGNVQNIISIDPLSVAETEVVLGPGSVIYGSDAIGGVINFYTLQPKFSSEGTSVTGNGYVRYATANEEKTGHVDVSVKGEKWAFLSSVSYSDFGDLRMGSHGPEEYLRPEYVVWKDGRDVVVSNEEPLVQVPTGYNQINLLEKLRFRANDQWDFNLGLLYSTTSDFPRYDRLYRKQDGVYRSAQWYYGPQRWMQAQFGIDKKGRGSFYDQARFNAAYQLFEEGRNDRNFGEAILYETDEHIDAFSFNLDFEKNFTINKIFYGIEYVRNELESRGRETNILTGEARPGTSRYPDGSNWQSMAAYGSFQWEVHPEMVLQSGIRYNLISLHAEFDEAKYDFPFSEADLQTGALTGSVGLNWQPSDLIGWKLNLSTAFRAPNIDDVGKIFDSAPGRVVVPNPHLRPEYAYNSEIGFSLNFHNKFMVDLTGYYTLLDNAMVRRDYVLNGQTIIEYQGEPSRVQAIQNSASAFVYGVEAGVKANFSEAWSFHSRVSWTEGKEEQEDGTQAALRHAAPFFGDAHLVWEMNRAKMDLSIQYNAEVSFEELAPSERDKPYLYASDEAGNPYAPEWYTLNFTGQYRISSAWLATAALENITDQRYRTYSSGIAAAGKNFILGLRYTF